ncbi:hypothetical protein [Azospirillum sp. TSA6c]|uniref:hypothetical protein n=1 Tax=Azospirillum sp. TSA6c TaxID=709813 RepID=UPI001304FEA7|nr:hypothetical protein [Azospirillum sp. TSA6c]
MGDVIDMEAHQPHETAELMCVDCRRRWQGVWPAATLLKELECPYCETVGNVIKTGQSQ